MANQKDVAAAFRAGYARGFEYAAKNPFADGNELTVLIRDACEVWKKEQKQKETRQRLASAAEVAWRDDGCPDGPFQYKGFIYDFSSAVLVEVVEHWRAEHKKRKQGEGGENGR